MALIYVCVYILYIYYRIYIFLEASSWLNLTWSIKTVAELVYGPCTHIFTFTHFFSLWAPCSRPDTSLYLTSYHLFFSWKQTENLRNTIVRSASTSRQHWTGFVISCAVMLVCHHQMSEFTHNLSLLHSSSVSSFHLCVSVMFLPPSFLLSCYNQGDMIFDFCISSLCTDMCTVQCRPMCWSYLCLCVQLNKQL